MNKLNMLTVVVLCLLQFTCGFLLDHGNSSIPGKQTYLTEAEYYSDKVQMQQELALQFQKMVSHDELNLLTVQLQSKLDAFEQKLLSQTSSLSQSSLHELEQKYQGLTQQLSTLEQKNKDLEQTLETKELEITELRQNLTFGLTEFQIQTATVQQKVGDLENLKSVVQIQTLHNIEQQTKTLTTQVNKLESTEQARGQDLVALYNKVNTMEMEEKSLSSLVRNNTVIIGNQKVEIESLGKTFSMKLENLTKHQNIALKELENKTSIELDSFMKQQTSAMKELENRTSNKLDSLKKKTTALMEQENKTSNELDSFKRQQTTQIGELENRRQADVKLQNESLTHLQQYVDGQLRPVILTACINDTNLWTEEKNRTFTFPIIMTSVGVPDQAHFQQTGRFRCSSPGYYFVTTTMETLADSTFIAIMVNSVVMKYQHVTGKANGAYTPGTTGFTLQLATGDEVWVRHETDKRSFYLSCFLIFKIK